MKFPFLTRAKSRQCDVNVDCKSSKSDHDCFIIFPTYDPGWSGHPIVGGVAGGVAGVAITIGIVIWKRKRNTANTKQVVAGGGVQTGNAIYDRNNQQETFSVQPSAVPVYAFEAAPTTEPTAFCANCGKANSKTAFCTVCGVPN
jgi:hypothetical protein